MKKLLLATGTALCLALPSISMAAGPGAGSDTKYDVTIGRCHADSMTVRWKLDSLMGEPTVAGSFEWEGDSNCSLPSSTTIWLKVANSRGGYGSVKLSPVVPDANDGFGYNTTGSPNWSRTLCGFQGTESTRCHDREEAVDLWKSGDVEDFVVAW